MPVYKNQEADFYSQKGETVQEAMLQQGEFNTSVYAALSLLAAQTPFTASFSALPDNMGYITQAISTSMSWKWRIGTKKNPETAA